MADYTKEDAKKDADTSTGAVVDGLIGLAALLIGGKFVSNISKQKKLDELREKKEHYETLIRQANDLIATLEGKILGSIRYADKINYLKSQRAEIQELLVDIERQISEIEN